MLWPVKLRLEYDYDCTAAEFWALYFDPAYTSRLYLDALDSTSAEVLKLDGDLESGLHRTLRYGQRPDAPGPVKKLFGEEIVTVEESAFDPTTGTSTFTVTPGTMADKTKIGGSVQVEDTPGGCHQRFDLEAKVKIFGVGPIVERFIEHQARDAQEKAAAHMRQTLAAT
jgi:hypothetical protein